MKFLFWILMIFLSLPMSIAAQGDAPKVLIPSPEIEMFTRFSDYPVNTQTGIPEIAIPLYEITSGDLKLPLSISYHSSGRRTYDRNGPLGLHWTLNTGGLVSRIVFGLRDDDLWQFPTPFPDVANLSVQNYYDLAGVNKSPGTASYYDTEYDIFSYFLNDNSGKFILKDVNNTKVPATIPNRDIKIHVNKISSPNHYFNYIEITDEFGVYYRFGESIVSGDQNTEWSGDAITGWFISEIISANKQDTISFKYTQRSKVRRTFPQRIKLRDDHHYLNSHRNASISDTDDQEVTLTTSYSSMRIREIHFKNGKILFGLNGSTDIIDKMDIYSENKLIKTIEFPKTIVDAPVGLSVFDGSQAINYKLDNVLFKDKNGVLVSKYTFDYYPSENFNVRKSDWWGYYNNSYSTTYRIPPFSGVPWVGTNGVPTITSIGHGSANRTPNLEAMKSGILKSIIYPTGGQTDFIYENNYYKEELTQIVKKGAGLRIAQERTKDNSGNIIVKTYKYGSKESGYGVINNEPTIGMIGYESTIVNLLNWDGWCRGSASQEIEFYRERYYFSDILPQYSIYFDRPIMYPEVTEYLGENGNNVGKTIYTYDSNKQYFAQLPYSTDYSISRKFVKVYNGWNENQLLKKEIFDSSGTRIKKESYSYSTKHKENITGMHLEKLQVYSSYDKEKCGATLSYPIFVFDSYTVSTGVKQLREKNEIVYSGSDSITTQTTFLYNQNYLINKLEKTVNNGVYTTYYYYPNDFTNHFANLRGDRNIIGVPVDVRTYYNNKLISGIQNGYNDFGQPTDFYNFESPLNDIPFNSLNPFTFQHRQTITYNVDKKPVKKDQVNDLKTYYVWAYKKQYPVAKIESWINTIVDVPVNDNNLSKSTALTSIKDDVAYLKSLLSPYLSNSSYMTTLYTYSPLVGMTSQTDPNGVTTYYEYDSFGRLARVKNDDNKVVKEYDYHYGGPSSLSASVSSLSYTSSSGSKSVSVTSNVPWTVSANQSWITVNPASGTSNGSFSVTCTSNTSTSSRSGTVTITGGGITKTISVSQEGAAPSSTLSASRTYLAFPAIALLEDVNVSSNTSWTATSSATWITVTPSSGTGNGMISIKPLKLLSGTRSGYVTLRTADGTKTVTINVFQDAELMPIE